jgi:hypothetical protein
MGYAKPWGYTSNRRGYSREYNFGKILDLGGVENGIDFYSPKTAASFVNIPYGEFFRCIKVCSYDSLGRDPDVRLPRQPQMFGLAHDRDGLLASAEKQKKICKSFR